MLPETKPYSHTNHHFNADMLARMKTEPLHFVAIGGIGMSAYAGIMRARGFVVQGSDNGENANTRRLQQQGVHVFVGHKAEQVAGAGVVVTSTALKADNPEVQAALQQHIPVVHRGPFMAAMLANNRVVAVSGTHGKTTTTALAYHVLKALGLQAAGVVVGGVLSEEGTNAIDNTSGGQGGLMVVEADESDQSFLCLSPEIAVITNIEPEHLEHYNGSFEQQQQAFFQFAASAKTAVLCTDDPLLKTMADTLQRQGHRVVRYGLQAGADFVAHNIQQHQLQTSFTVTTHGKQIGTFTVNLPGRHYAQNALAAMVVGHVLGVPFEDMAPYLQNFGGVGRRFNTLGTFCGAVVVDDYAHHPTEIAATLNAARAGCHGRLVAVIQPHRYTRLQHHMTGFARCAGVADEVIVAPVYAAGEPPLEGVNHYTLAQQAGAKTVENFAELKQWLQQQLQPGDMVMMLGAGDITTWARQLVAVEDI